MTDVTNELKDNARHDRAAAEWGLASLLMGSLLALTAMLMLHVNLQMYHNPRAWWPDDVRPLRYVVMVGALALAGLTGASLAFGVRGLLLANRRQQPAALACAGILIALFAGFLWIITLVNFFSVTDMLLRITPLPRL